VAQLARNIVATISDRNFMRHASTISDRIGHAGYFTSLDSIR
jgi:hypothetical protein